MNDQQHDSTRLRRLNATFVEIAIHLGLLSFLIYSAFVLVSPFIAIAGWSVVLAVAINPVYERLKTLLGGRGGWAAAALTLLGLLIVLGPATWLGIDLLEASKGFIMRVEHGELTIPAPSESVKSWPLIGAPVYEFWQLAYTNTTGALTRLAPQLKPFGEVALSTVSSAGAGTVKFLVSVIIMGFLLSSGPRLVAAANTLARRVDPGYGERFVALSGATIRAVSRGVIGIALMQAVIGGVGMWLAGVPFASLLTLAILVLGIVQIGPLIVALPLVAYAWTEMPTLNAVGVTLCMVLVYVVEAVGKPFVLAHGLTTPTLVIFLGVIGGIVAHGIPGLFVGPIVLAVAWELAKAWIYDDGSGDGAQIADGAAPKLTPPTA